tara:strand:- start:1397 stop:2008 length:612 start_codon:yes stop_codon:yes gene_type:complete
MKKKTMYKIIILILFTFILPKVKIPPQDIEGWKILNEKDPWVGYVEYENFPWCRATDIFPYSINEIEQFIGKFDTYSNTFSRMIDSDLVDTNVVYLRVDYPFFLSDRDYLVKYSRLTDNKDVYYQWIAEEHPELPEYDNVVRLINAGGEWALKYINDNSTKVSYSWNGELRGDFPSFSLNSAWNKAGTEIINELRHAIENSSK